METIYSIKSLYETAFPPDERCDFDELLQLFVSENDMHVKTVFLDGELLGFIIYWAFEHFVFVENFAVNEKFRGHGHGAGIFTDFLKNAAHTVVLEVEPPDNPVAIKRIQFYERLGMTLHHFPYMQPPYGTGKNPVKMQIMSYGEIKTASDFEKMKSVIYENVYLNQRLPHF
jgi:ribosomal protein S18 acetylase RimI-like enzyme